MLKDKKKDTLFSVSFFLSCPNNLDAAAQSSNGPSGPRRECGANSECSEELRRGGFADPEHFKIFRNPKRNTSQQAGVSFWRCHPDLNWGVELLQSSALPLGYGTLLKTEQRILCSVIGASDEARTRYLHLGKVALYQMSYTRIFGVPRKVSLAGDGASGRNRTNDTRIFSPLLYQLSYRGKWRLGRDLNPRPPA